MREEFAREVVILMGKQGGKQQSHLLSAVNFMI